MARLLRKNDQQEYARGSGRKEDPVGRAAHDNEFDAEFEILLSRQIDEDYIVSVTGVKDVKRIEYISLQIDTKEQSLYDLTEILPSLKHLVLDNSYISSVRDLGIGLRFITSLSLSSCNLRDLDGIGVLEGLQELCVSDNLLSDITPLNMHENLQNLNLTNNRLVNLSFGFVLSSCSRLRSLFLSKNPLDRMRQYRAVVSHLVPGLEMLDGLPVDQQLASKITQSILEESEEELKTIEDELNEERRLHDDIFGDGHDTQDNLPIPIVDLSSKSGQEILPDNGSELTHGTGLVLAGNMAAAMRRRRADPSSSASSSSAAATATVDLLDSALNPSSMTRLRSSREEYRIPFISEGDVTAMVLGSPQRGLGAEHQLRLLGGPTASHSPQKQSSTHSRTRDSYVAGGGMSYSSFEPDGSLFTSRSSKERPKSAFSGSALRASDKSYEQHPAACDSPTNRSPADDDHNTTIAGMMEPSPRQRNSSRPQSAAITEASILFGSRSLPFSIGSDASLSPASASASAAATAKAPQSQGWGTKRLVGVRTDGDDDITTLAAAAAAASGSGSSSIVHLNIVRRQHKEAADTSSKVAQGIATLTVQDTEDNDDDNNNNDGDDDDDDDDDIGIAHSSRHRRMARQDNNSSSNSQMLRQRQGVLDKLKGSKGANERKLIDELAGSGAPAEVLDKMFTAVSVPAIGKKCNSVAVAGKASMSSTAGKSLGFNLINSLAAIDKWVQDASNTDGDDDDDDDDNNDDNGKVDKEDNKQEHDDFVIFSDTTPRPNSREDNSSNNNNNNNNTHNKSQITPRSAASVKDKILSRDAIFQMCWNSSGKRSDSRPNSALTQEDSIISEGSLPGRINRSDSDHDRRAPVPGSRNSRISTMDTVVDNSLSGVSTASSRKPVKAAIATASAESEAVLVTAVEKKEKVPPVLSKSAQKQRAINLTDDELVDLLRKPPKTVVHLRTRAGFQEFFRGVDMDRFRRLLALAYADITDPTDREAKISRRMSLMSGVE